MKKKNILFVTSEFPPGPGGIGNHAFNLTNTLYKSGYCIEVISGSDNNVNNEAQKSFPYKVFRYPQHNFRIIKFFKKIQFIFNIVESKKYDVILLSGLFSLIIGYLLKKKTIKLKIIAITHGIDINPSNYFLKKVVRKSLNLFDYIVCVSNYTCNKIKGVSTTKTVIPNGIDLTEFEESNPGKVNLKGFPSLLTVGTISQRKGQQNVIKALPDLLEKFPDIHYHCVGHKQDETTIKKIIKNLNMEERVTLHGVVSREKLFEYYNSADVFIMLSEEQKSGDFEGFGIAILEANYFGLPAIGSKNSGIEDAIINASTGFLVDPKSSAEIGEAISIIINKRSKYSSAAIPFAKNHAWDNLIKRYLILLK